MSDLLNEDGSVNKDALLLELESIEQNLSHDQDCPARHCGECLCPRNHLLLVIAELQK